MHAARADLLRRLGRVGEARCSYLRALALVGNGASAGSSSAAWPRCGRCREPATIAGRSGALARVCYVSSPKGFSCALSGLAAFAFALCSSAMSAQTMSITSSSFPAGGAIPLKYTCDAGWARPIRRWHLPALPPRRSRWCSSWTIPTCPRRWCPRASSCTGWSGTCRRIPRASLRAKARAASTAWAGPATWAHARRPHASLLLQALCARHQITTRSRPRPT